MGYEEGEVMLHVRYTFNGILPLNKILVSQTSTGYEEGEEQVEPIWFQDMLTDRLPSQVRDRDPRTSV